jgi:hypothetical protein
MATRNPTGKRRAEAALQLRMAGSSYDDIAFTLGYRNGATAQQTVEQALARGIDQATREQQRELAARRIERLLRSVWPKANDPAHPEHLPAVRAARELIDRHARLYGLDELPDISTRVPSDAELVRWVTDVLSYTVRNVEEANVVDVEIVEEVADGTAGRAISGSS